MNEEAVLLVFVVMILIPLIGLALLISSRSVRNRRGDTKTLQSFFLVTGSSVLAFSLVGIVVATGISAFVLIGRDLDFGGAITALIALALAAVLACAGVAGIRLSRALSTIGPRQESDAVDRQISTLRWLGWTFILIPLLFFIPALIVTLVLPIFLFAALFIVFATHIRAQHEEEGHQLLSHALRKFHLSSRAHDSILKVARTIADLVQSEKLETWHLAEALNYRCLDKEINF